LKRLLCLVGVAFILGSEAWPQGNPPPPPAGFSFSPLTSIWAHRDPVQDLTRPVDA
jgi:hypothetical protein